MNKMKIFLAVMLAVLYGYETTAQDKGEGIVTVKKTDDFQITGTGSADNWKKTEWINIPQRKQKSEPYETRAKVLYSGTGIYFLFDCADKKLVSTITADFEDLWYEDVVEIFLWPEERFPVYFEYELSPMNYELPIIIPNDNGNFIGWRPWHYEGEKKTRHETSVRGGKKESGADITGWVAEFFIPYTLLKPLPEVPPKSGTKWRANMYRIDYDHGQTTFSWQETRKTFHDYERFGTFIFE